MRTPNRPSPLTRFRRPRGFTMVELLVVIGIIVILMSILIPAVGRVQIQARIADTRQQLSKIQSALENYYKDYHAYPGPVPNVLFDYTPPNPPNSPMVGTEHMTMTENAGLGLWGGWDIDPTGVPKAVYNEGSVGKGPVAFHPNPTKQKRSPAYLDPMPGQMTPTVNAANQWGSNGLTGNGKPGFGDSQIPEFMDKFSEARPILFLRANVGATNVLPGYPAPGNTPYQYNQAWVAQYAIPQRDFDDSATGQMTKDFPQRTINGVTIPAGWPSYIAHPSILGVPRGQNAYILISAGADGKFGTKDDLFLP
jgi:prepilin-type N-terminal cleavage/methylation domain-containing protein